MISQITECEIFDSDYFEVTSYEVQGKRILLKFDMPFLLSAWNGDKALFRITAAAYGTCAIPDIGEYNWDELKTENMGSMGLLANSNLVDILSLNYSDEECDDVSFLDI